MALVDDAGFRLWSTQQLTWFSRLGQAGIFVHGLTVLSRPDGDDMIHA
ncbi:MAG: hypothetical protein LBV45_10520 [Xanthomonadaceae bacterium]|nr:hypothetical protein [Xanthomonadaceae bacterium]